MKARRITTEQPGGERTPISELVPLATPLVVQIFPVYACNFTCKYCTMSIKKSDREFISDVVMIESKLFRKCVDDMKQFPDKVKVLRFVGMGEPLLHKELVEMIHYAHEAGIFERIEVITNASLLTPDLSERLVDAGLTKLLISIQGTSADKYLEISHIKLNFEKFVDNIRFFYNNKRDTSVHIKIVDCSLDGADDEALFFDMFGDICDTIGVEYVGPIHDGVECNEEIGGKTVNQYGADITKTNICSQPFYLIQINPDGKVVPCYSLTYPIIIGNCYEKSLVDIWNGKRFKRFQRKMLGGISNLPDKWVCTNCDIFKHRACSSDDLDSKAEELKKLI